MAKTLELFDGVTTLNLDGSVYIADVSKLALASALPKPVLAGTVLRNVRYGIRPISMGLQIRGTSALDLEKQIRALNDMLSFAERRQILDDGTTKVVLKYQVGTTDARDIQTRVLSGVWQPDGAILNETTLGSNSGFLAKGTLSLTCEPFGRLANVVYTERILFPEQDSNSVNFIDLAGPFNSHLVMAGAAGAVTVSDAAAIQNQFDSGAEISVRVWVDTDGEGNNGFIVEKGAWSFHVNNESAGTVRLRWNYGFSDTGGVWTTTDRPLNTGEWYRIYISYDNASVANNPTIGVYREATRTSVTLTVGAGITEDTPPVGTRTTDVGSDLLFGNRAADDRTFDGKMDDPRWYGTTGNAASEDQDGELIGSETNLIHYWPWDEGNGTIVNNKDTTNTETGTIAGATWGIDTHIEGDAQAPLRVKVTESGAYGSAGNIWLATRSGERRADTLFDSVPNSITEGSTPFIGSTPVFSSGTSGGLTTNAEGGASAFMRWTNSEATSRNWNAAYTQLGYATYTQSGSALPKGLFRVLVRVAIRNQGLSNPHTDLGMALGYVFGGKTVVPISGGEVLLPSDDTDWHILDMGELSIPPAGLPESAFTPPDLDIRAYFVATADAAQAGDFDQNDFIDCSIDWLFLLPVDESVVVASVNAAAPNRLYTSAISDSPGVWVLTESDVVSSVPDFNGGPLQIGPEDTRLYYLKDDTGDPSSVSSKLLIEYEPQIRVL